MSITRGGDVRCIGAAPDFVRSRRAALHHGRSVMGFDVMECSHCRNDRVFCPLSPGLRAVLDTLKTTAGYAKGAVAFHEGERCHTVFAVCSGSVKLVTSSTEGKVLLLRFAGPGDILGLSEAVLGHGASRESVYECTAIAAEPAVLAAIPSERFIRFVSSYPEAALRLAQALSEQYRIAQRETKFLAFGETSIVRLARLFLEWSAERGVSAADGVHIRSVLTHTEIAQSIGATRETVTRIMSNLSARGIVARGAGEIVIRSNDELVRVASH